MAKESILDCDDCGNTTIGEWYQLKNHLWLSVAKRDENLCVNCLEKRLKRKLTPKDFELIYFNFGDETKKHKSQILLDRLGLNK